VVRRSLPLLPVSPTSLRALRVACSVAVAVVGAHLLLVLTHGGYAFSLAGETVGSHRIRVPMMLLAALIAALVIVTSRGHLRDLAVSRRVRAACAWCPLDPRRPAQSRDAEEPKSEDQVPRELPPVCPLRTSGGRPRVLHARRGEPLHANCGLENCRRKLTAEEGALFGIDKLNAPRSDIPAVTHGDYSARIQTAHREPNPPYHALITAFKARTRCPVVVNTSFNVRGEPLVHSPEDAFRCFMPCEMDTLVVGNCFLDKREQDPALRIDYKDKFELDRGRGPN
jgi:hypothetical protein